MQNQLLLVQDVDNLGRSGDIVKVKPGYARNFLLPQKKAVVANKFTLRLQSKLKEERIKQAAMDKEEAELLARQLEGKVLVTEVKVDPDGHMYGSVAAIDIVRLFADEQIALDKKHVVLPHPIKALGAYPITLKLKEGVPAQITLHIIAEGGPGLILEEYPQ